MAAPSCFRLLAALLVTGGAVVAGCGTPGETETEAEPRVVHVALDGARLIVESVGPAAEPRANDPRAAATELRWEMREDGRRVEGATIPDPRIHVGEVLSGALARTVRRSDDGVFAIRTSRTSGELVLLDGDAVVARGELGALSTIAPRVLGSAEDAGSPPLTKIVDGGSCPTNVNLLVMPEGFTASELDRFHDRARALAEDLFAVAAYGRHRDQFNVWVADVPSAESGISDPGCACTTPACDGAEDRDYCPRGPRPQQVRQTAFRLQFGAKPTPRRAINWRPDQNLGEVEGWKPYRRATRAIGDPNTILIVLANTAESAGSADIERQIVFLSSTADAGRALAHELGHTLLGLTDEYASSTCDLAKAGGFPNSTKSPDAPPWRGVHAAPPVEGAEYCAKGVFRPTASCLMRDLGSELCPVCTWRLDDAMASRRRDGMSKDAKACASPSNCATDPARACRRGLVCSSTGGAGACCRTPSVITKSCATSEQCPSGTICARVTEGSTSGLTLGCVAPMDGCVE